MILSPVTAYKLAAQAETAQRERDTARKFAADMNAMNLRLHADLRVARTDLDAANAKIARMTGGLKQHRAKSPA